MRFLREPGEAARGGLRALELAGGETAVWDGRFEICAPQALSVRPLAGLAGRLPKSGRGALAAFAARARPGLPVSEVGDAPTCLVFDATLCRPLALERLRAALGVIDREPA